MQIKTFGPVDERSFEQLRRCMEAGEAELGVLCADHHRLPDVLAAHGPTIRVKHRLRPLGVAMAGGDMVDPYKD